MDGQGKKMEAKQRDGIVVGVEEKKSEMIGGEKPYSDERGKDEGAEGPRKHSTQT